MRRLSFLLTLLFLLSASISFSQADSSNIRIFVTNESENDSWLSALDLLEISQQIEKIKQRLLADTVALKTDSSWTVKAIQPLTIEFYCRPLIIINQDTVLIETPTQTKEFVSIINETKFRKLKIMYTDKAKETYGRWGICGALILETKDRKISARLKQIGV